jgi:hypothetical protein
MSTTVQSLQKTQRDKQRRQQEIYKKFLETCHNRITLRNSLGYTSMHYQVPPFVIGYSIYNHEHAIKYVEKELLKGGFRVERYGVDLYIDWTRHKRKKKA